MFSRRALLGYAASALSLVAVPLSKVFPAVKEERDIRPAEPTAEHLYISEECLRHFAQNLVSHMQTGTPLHIEAMHAHFIALHLYSRYCGKFIERFLHHILQAAGLKAAPNIVRVDNERFKYVAQTLPNLNQNIYLVPYTMKPSLIIGTRHTKDCDELAQHGHLLFAQCLWQPVAEMLAALPEGTTVCHVEPWVRKEGYFLMFHIEARTMAPTRVRLAFDTEDDIWRKPQA